MMMQKRVAFERGAYILSVLFTSSVSGTSSFLSLSLFPQLWNVHKGIYQYFAR